MKTTNHTILITGGGSGIGLETARLFANNGNRIIITGRDEEKLKRAAAELKNTVYIVADVTDEASVNQLVKQIHEEFPTLDILVNNAGKAFAYTLSENSGAFEKATDEMLTNYLAPVRLTEKLLPLLARQREAAIINVSSIVSFAPGAGLPTYSASKAALHSYSQTLRLTLQRAGSIKVFEVMPPLVDTEFAKSLQGTKISPATVAQSILEGLETDSFEIHTASTADLYQVFLGSPGLAFNHLNGVN